VSKHDAELADVFVHFKRLQDPLMKLATYVPPTKGVRSEQNDKNCD